MVANLSLSNLWKFDTVTSSCNRIFEDQMNPHMQKCHNRMVFNYYPAARLKAGYIEGVRRP